MTADPKWTNFFQYRFPKLSTLPTKISAPRVIFLEKHTYKDLTNYWFICAIFGGSVGNFGRYLDMNKKL
jgi:hypothetical protein